MKKIMLAMVLAMGLTGCVGTDAAKGFTALSSNLAKDHALLIINNDLMTPWGQQKGRIVRVGDLTNTVIVSPEGVVTVNPVAKTP